MRKNKMIAMMMAATLVCTTFTGCGGNGSAMEPTLGAGETVNEPLTEESKVMEESKVEEESKAVEESKVEEESKVMEESKVEEESKAVEESKVEEESKVVEESKVEEESKVAEESKASTPAAPETPAPSPEQSEAPAAETLPGINRNGRYADIPETVLPSSVAANAEFVDEPIYTKPWPDVTGTIYADYMRTQVIKVAEYGVDDCMLIAYCGADEANGKYGNCIVIYNGQYAIINEVLFAVWVNGIDPEYN